MMKKVQTKFFDPPPNPDEMIIALNKEGDVGWHFIHAIMTNTGQMRFMLERTTDEEVDATDVDAYEKAQKEAELMSKFGPGVSSISSKERNIRQR